MAHLIACPECKKHLQVPDNLIGKKVQCPECKHTFVASIVEPEEGKIATTSSSAPKKPAWEKDPDSEPVRKRKRRIEEDDDGPEDRDDEEEELPTRRRRRSRSSVPHRGGMILAFGIIGIVAIPIFGIIAWVMGSSDLREIQAGRMDPEGEGLTQAGRVLGMIGTGLGALYIVGCGAYFCCIFAFVGIAANANKGNFQPPAPPRRF